MSSRPRFAEYKGKMYPVKESVTITSNRPMRLYDVAYKWIFRQPREMLRFDRVGPAEDGQDRYLGYGMWIIADSADDLIEVLAERCIPGANADGRVLTYHTSSVAELESAPNWVYHNWHRERALIHAFDCPDCQYGQGKQNEVSGENCEWLPFSTLDEAWEFVLALKYAPEDARLCLHCEGLPQEPKPPKPPKPPAKPVRKLPKGRLYTVKG